jgi:hypothetical protein
MTDPPTIIKVADLVFFFIYYLTCISLSYAIILNMYVYICFNFCTSIALKFMAYNI